MKTITQNSLESQPTASVIMPCYNASRFLREAIDSVRSQTYEDWELLVVDDGSSDDSVQIVSEYVTKDARVRLIQQPNSGACVARNNGIEHARGRYIKFLDADDILCPNCLEEQIHQIEQLQPNQIPFGDYGHIDAEGNVISTYSYSNGHLDALKGDQVFAMFSFWQILISAPLHRKELLIKIGGYDVELPRHQETFFHICLALADVQFIYYPTFTFYYREYTSTYRITSNYRSGKIKEDVLRREVYVPKLEAVLLKKYAEMPKKYRPYFANEYFYAARYYYSQKQVELADQCIKKAEGYGVHSKFMRSYIRIGDIVGFTIVEAILQWRLKLLGKK